LPRKVKPRQKPERQYKEDDDALPTIEEPHDSDYEPVEDDKDSRAGSAACSASFTSVKNMIRHGLDELLSAHSFYQCLNGCHLHYFSADIDEEALPKGNLIWKTLPDYLMERGIQLTGWPQSVLFPTQKLKPDAGRKSGQGIKDIGINGTRLLAEKLTDPQGSVKLTKVDIDGKCSL